MLKRLTVPLRKYGKNEVIHSFFYLLFTQLLLHVCYVPTVIKVLFYIGTKIQV